MLNFDWGIISETFFDLTEKSSIYCATWWSSLNIYRDVKYKNCNTNDVTRDLFGKFGHFLPNLSSHFISNMSFIITRQIISPHNFIKLWILKILKNIWTGIGSVYYPPVRRGIRPRKFKTILVDTLIRKSLAWQEMQ